MGKRILIIDRQLGCYGEDAFPDKRAEHYQRFLESKGYSVDILKDLHHSVPRAEGEPKKDVSEYDFVIAHPNAKDAQILRDEVENRADFRVILNTETPSYHPELDFTDSDQVFAFYVDRVWEWQEDVTHETEERLIQLIENGW